MPLEATQSLDGIDHKRLPRCYDGVKVCSLCSQFFGDVSEYRVFYLLFFKRVIMVHHFIIAIPRAGDDRIEDEEV